jgi:hypothetical protein
MNYLIAGCFLWEVCFLVVDDIAIQGNVYIAARADVGGEAFSTRSGAY